MRTICQPLALCLACLASSASAAQFSLQLTPVAVYAADFTPLPWMAFFPLDGVMRIYEFDLQIATSDLQPGERGFGNVGFNIQLDGLTEAGAGGWAPNTSTTDSNGVAPGGVVPLFSTNADAGPSPTDLQGIFATIAGGITSPNASDARVKIGQPGGPNSLGHVFVKWNSNAQAIITVENTQWSVYSDAGVFSSSQGFGSRIVFTFPEPASVAMAGMGLVGIIALARRRTI